MFALMITCRAGTLWMPSDGQWADVMHTITWSSHATTQEAWEEAERLRPIGFNRERISFQVRPWDNRF